MIEFVFGKRSNPLGVSGLVAQLKDLNLNGTLYIGYPIFDVDDESLLTDALLVTEEHGVLVFDLTTSRLGLEQLPDIEEYQDDLYRGLNRKFLTEKKLIVKRQLSFEIQIASIREDGIQSEDISITNLNGIQNLIRQGSAVDPETYKVINSTIQKTSVLRPLKKRTNVETENSFGWTIKKIEKEVANLDRWQKKAAIESPEKPQRIRGLAGCGKTIILAMKAAYLHAIEPNLNIVVTFQSRALYQQLERLVGRFYFEHLKEEIDPSKLQIIHSWGSSTSAGLYSQICFHLGLSPLSWREASQKYGKDNAFEGACSEVLHYINGKPVVPLYDYILIDEAQDFPVSFFQLIYQFVKSPKHIVWAYDELQNLGEYSMLPPEQLFGSDANGASNVTLDNEDGKPQQDIMLPICYRNPPWTLTLALGLGLGIHRKEGLVRMFPEPKFWEHIGYEVVGGNLSYNKAVSIQRNSDRTPDYFHDYIDHEQAILYESFNRREEQAAWIANQIHKNIARDELEISDILVVFPDAYTLNSESAYLINELRKFGIDSHIVGVNTSRNVVFTDESVAITHVYRAKGNEAPMVYVANANYCYSGLDIRKKRNALFTSITRAKAWVRITGVGPNMNLLKEEIDQIFSDNFILKFIYPSLEEMNNLDQVFQDKTPEEKQQIYDGFEKIKEIKSLFDSGEISFDDIPDELKILFKQ